MTVDYHPMSTHTPDHELPWTQDYVQDRVHSTYQHTWKSTITLGISILITAAAATFMAVSYFDAQTDNMDTVTATTHQGH